MLRLCTMLFAPALLALVAPGCGTTNPVAPASISGSVTLKGKPVTGGSVQFYTQSGTPYSASIAADGTYSVADIPLGETIVCVETESINPVHKASKGKEAAGREAMMGGRQAPSGQGGGGGGSKSEEGKYVEIPKKYSNPKTSPLTLNVKNGRQVHNIELE
jgi:hypothetical protein